MIEEQYLGKTIKSVPVSAFENRRFDTPNTAEERYPGLVLASDTIIPKEAMDWYLQSTAYMGYSIMGKYAAIKPLSIKSSIESLLQNIVDETFEVDNLGYATSQADLSSYESFISEFDLTYSKEKSGELRQALYPLDATQHNLSILTDDEIDLSLYDDVDLKIYIVGENCD